MNSDLVDYLTGYPVAITFGSEVISTTTKLSLEIARKPIASAGYVSDVQCQEPAE